MRFGVGLPPYIVAELSANHLGSFSRALKIMKAAADAGADAVKLQTYQPEKIAIPGMRLETGPWKGRALLDLYEEAQTPRAWHKPLFDYGRELGIEVFSSAFSPDDVDFLETLDCPAYKIASFEIVDLGLIRHAALTGKPVIISTGMASERDILAAKDAAPEATFLHCVSGYPTPMGEANLTRIRDLWMLTDGDVGFSDHTLGSTAAIAAVAIGAVLVEKHLTLERADGGPDAAFSAEPAEFAQMVKGCHDAWEAMRIVHPSCEDSQRALRGRTLVA